MKLSDKVVDYVLKLSVDDLHILSVKSVALGLNMDRRHLWRVFKAERGVTLETYIFRIKINEVSYLLREYPELTIKEVASKVGYSRCDYIIRVFKNFYGMTPGKFRDIKGKK